MRKLALIFFVGMFTLQTKAQVEDNYSNIKLFVSRVGILTKNTSLDSNQRERLYTKTQQLITKTGIAELGYSTFLVSPKLDTISVSVDQTGIGKVYLAECELSITIERMTVGGQGGAVFNSFSKNITGSGMSKAEAIRNAVSSISPSDARIVAFLNTSKQMIDKYFQVHCKDVVKQAEQALAIKNYELSIALYFSVPTNAPCHLDALKASEGVYNTYQMDQCDKNLIKLKAYVAMALNDLKSSYYDEAMKIINTLTPTSKCYIEASKEIEKIEKRFTEEQKQEWDLIKKQSHENSDVKKEMYKAMGRISSNYQPSSDKTIIIAH